MTFFNIFSKQTTQTPKIHILVDHREKNSLVISELIKKGYEIELVQLPVGDFIVGDTAIERKTISDLKSSIINKRIFKQLKELQQFKQRILIVEGFDERAYHGQIHENALKGFLLSTVQKSQVPLIYSLNEKDTATYIELLAKKKPNKEESLRAKKIFLTPVERVQFILEGFPGIGPTTAQKLIATFGTLEAILIAPETELEFILGKKTTAFKEIIRMKLKP